MPVIELPTRKFTNRVRNAKGQILVEYLLLMIIAIACGTLMTKALVGRSESKTGTIIKQWDRIIRSIGNDMPDCSKQNTYASPNCPP